MTPMPPPGPVPPSGPVPQPGPMPVPMPVGPEPVQRRSVLPLVLAAAGALVALVIAAVVVLVVVNHKPAEYGSTRITVHASLPSGGAPDVRTLDQSGQILADRAEARGLTGVKVSVEADSTVVLTVAGAHEKELRGLVTPAELRFRKVLALTPDVGGPADTPAVPSPGGSVAASPGRSSAPVSGGSIEQRRQRALDALVEIITREIRQLSPEMSAADARASAEAFLAKVSRDPSQLDQQTASSFANVPAEPFLELARSSPETIALLPPTLLYNLPQVTCSMLDRRPSGSVSDVSRKAVACSRAGSRRTKYFMDIAKVVGADVAHASAANDAQRGWYVTLEFTSGEGQRHWTDLTREAFENKDKTCATLDEGGHCAVAIVVDNAVISAPTIQAVIAGDAQITGAFTGDEAGTLAAQLTGAALPVVFEVRSVEVTR